MRVIELSTSDIGGGAAIAAYRLHTALKLTYIDATMIVSQKKSNDAAVLGNETLSLRTTLSRYLDALPTKFFTTSNTTLHSPSWIADGTFRQALTQPADIIQLHWICAAFLTPKLLLKFQQPIVWTLHDMWAFCGAEHYTADTRFITGYTSTNRPTDESGWDLNRWAWQRKKIAWQNLSNLTLVTPSNWLKRLVKQSALFKNHRVEVIPNGIDTNIFSPGDQEAAQKALHLPIDKHYILFAADYIQDKRKGIDYLYQALQRLQNNPSFTKTTELIIFGHGNELTLKNNAFKIHFLGHLNKATDIAKAFRAADVFVLPSKQDNLPNSVLEALSCGTPCVSFNIGGLPDMIKHLSNGYLAKAFDVNDLARGISWVLSDMNKRRILQTRARKSIEQHFTLEHQAKRYINLYTSVLKS
ncbi:MAG: glycosyltransferase [Patescibacteria group bacterium]|jgi:glycosyltransferase involved in cell wall biosynthesis